MKTIIRIAWRNLWRNKLRTFVIILSIILGLWGSIFFMGMMNGMNEGRIRSAINTYLAHVQVHQNKYAENPVLSNNIKNYDKVIRKIKQDKSTEGITARTLVSAMASSSKGSYGIALMGVNPEEEKTISIIADKLIEGTFLTRYKKPAIVIGKKLADKLGVKLKSKVKISFQNTSGDIMSYAFRVEGIYKLNNSMIERSRVFMKRSDLHKFLGTDKPLIHEIIIKLDNIDKAESFKTKFQKNDTGNTYLTWNEVAPELGYAQETMAAFAYIFMAIILIALSFAIINTMLMAVLERKRELGIMMSIGFNKPKLFAMIMTETVFIALIAAPVGLLISYLTVSYFQTHGIRFISVEKGMEYFGVGATIYTKLEPVYYWVILIMTLATALISAIFPARKALATKPIEAIREV